MGIIKLHRLLCAALLLTGCAASNNPVQPTARKAAKAPPMPPTPPGLKIQKASTASISTTVVSSTPDSKFISAARFGDVADDGGTCVAVDRNGNVFVGGTVTVDTGSLHPFLMKRSPSGAVVWSNTFPGNVSGSITALGVDHDGNVLVTGNFFSGLLAGSGFDFGGGITLISSNASYDIFVAKIASDGSRAFWAKRFGGPWGGTSGFPIDDNSYGLAVDTNDNSVVVTGYYGSGVDFGGGPLPQSNGKALFLVKLSLLDGTYKWAHSVNGIDGFTQGAGVAIDAIGNVFLTGFAASRNVGMIDFGGGPIQSSGVQGMFVAKYTAAGGYIWAKQFGALAEGRGVALDQSGNVIVTGKYNLTIYFGGQTLTNMPQTSPFALPSSTFVAKFLAGTGSHLWSKRMSGGIAAGVSIAPSGNITFASAGPLIVGLAPDGTERWSKSFAGDSQCSSVATDASGRSYVVGKFFGTVDFGGGPVASAGRADIFLVELGEPAATPPASTGTMQISEKFVDPVNGDIFIVSDLQQANMDIAFRMQTRPGGPRQTIGTWGASPISQRVGVSLQAGLPVAWVDTVQTTPAAAAARMAPASLTDTGWRTKGYKIYRTGSRTFVLKP